MPDALAALSALGVNFAADQPGAFRGIRFIDGPRSVSASFPSGPARGVRRTHLHDLLHRRASGLGTCFLWQTQVLALDRQPDRVTLQTTAGPAQARWVIGADGLNSRIRLWSGLDRGAPASKRIGLRTHLRVAPWSEFVEVYWSDSGQAYVTPIGSDTIGLAIVARHRRDLRSIDDALPSFPALAARLAGAERQTQERGSATLNRKLPHVTTKRVALIGDASGSVDAVTGEGLGLAFRQAIALGAALAANELAGYERAHREIYRRPAIMSRVLLLLDRYPAFRRLALQSLSRRPELFEGMLAVHTGEVPFTLLGRTGALMLGAQLLRG
ncbi:MAG: NAD(P)/FAD-dependent oxidoreductase [Acidobacteriaceae bacterium]